MLEGLFFQVSLGVLPKAVIYNAGIWVAKGSVLLLFLIFWGILFFLNNKHPMDVNAEKERRD
jgi:hypothetical protein